MICDFTIEYTNNEIVDQADVFGGFVLN